VTRCYIDLSDNYFLYFSCRTPSLTRVRVCNLQCNDASSVSGYIATNGLSASSSWCRTPNGAHNQILIYFPRWGVSCLLKAAPGKYRDNIPTCTGCCVTIAEFVLFVITAVITSNPTINITIFWNITPHSLVHTRSHLLIIRGCFTGFLFCSEDVCSTFLSTKPHSTFNKRAQFKSPLLCLELQRGQLEAELQQSICWICDATGSLSKTTQDRYEGIRPSNCSHFK
jgi:hypothetical protein